MQKSGIIEQKFTNFAGKIIVIPYIISIQMEQNLLRIAIQSKGRLYDDTIGLLKEAGIKINRS